MWLALIYGQEVWPDLEPKSRSLVFPSDDWMLGRIIRQRRNEVVISHWLVIQVSRLESGNECPSENTIELAVPLPIHLSCILVILTCCQDYMRVHISPPTRL